MATQYWYQNAIFYEVSVRAFKDANGDGIGDLIGLTQKLDYFSKLGVDCLWLLPIYKSPLMDDGYDIADFCAINPDYGDLNDFKNLLNEAHKRKIKIIMDLVMNHTSDQHPWFKEARADRNSVYHDYYVWNTSEEKYKQARIIFVDTEKSNWTWNEATQEYYWHRFYTCQPDLNYDNPAVITEMLRVVEFWLNLGIDGFRVDAVPYLIEREGTNCENLPETHAILKKIREFVDTNYSDKVLICEANQWPKDVREYFGAGDEFQVAFNFPIMPRIFMALKKTDSAPIKWALDQLPAIPENCQWGTFLRNHDELTLEMVSEEERQFMWKEYSPDLRYRLNLGIRRRLTPLLDNNRRKLELVFALLFSLPGTPFIYYGDEIGMGDDINLFDRNGLRTPMQWEKGAAAGFSKAIQTYSPVITDPEYAPDKLNVADQILDPSSFWHKVQQMISLRKSNPAFSSPLLQWIDCSRKEVVAFSRGDEQDRVLAIHNLSNANISLSIPIQDFDTKELKDLFTNKYYPVKDQSLIIELAPYQFSWLEPHGVYEPIPRK